MIPYPPELWGGFSSCAMESIIVKNTVAQGRHLVIVFQGSRKTQCGRKHQKRRNKRVWYWDSWSMSRVEESECIEER
eukprot:1341181-Amphidinium_carterae.1